MAATPARRTHAGPVRAADRTLPPDQMLRAAWLYYGEHMTQADIASAMKLARARVIALLAAARDSGVVRVHIEARGRDERTMGRALAQRFALHEAIVVPAPSTESAAATVVGHAAGSYLGSRLRDGMSVGVGWGATLHAALKAVSPRPLARVAMVSLLGSVTHSRTITPATVARRLADAFGAECYQLTAPLVVSGPAVRDALWSEPGLADLRHRAREVDLALLSVGDMSPQSTLFREALLTAEDLRGLVAAGAVGDVLCHFLGAAGRPVAHPIGRRTMSVALDDLARVPEIVVASGGRRKAPALFAALQALSVRVLITDAGAARELLALAGG